MVEYGLETSDVDLRKAKQREKSFSSKEKYFKAFKQNVVSINVTAVGSYSVEVVHGLGYVPVYIFFGAFDSSNLNRRYRGEATASGPGGTLGSDSYIDKEKLVIGWNEPTGTGHSYPFKVTFYYYIFYDKLE